MLSNFWSCYSSLTESQLSQSLSYFNAITYYLCSPHRHCILQCAKSWSQRCKSVITMPWFDVNNVQWNTKSYRRFLKNEGRNTGWFIRRHVWTRMTTKACSHVYKSHSTIPNLILHHLLTFSTTGTSWSHWGIHKECFKLTETMRRPNTHCTDHNNFEIIKW